MTVNGPLTIYLCILLIGLGEQASHSVLESTTQTKVEFKLSDGNILSIWLHKPKQNQVTSHMTRNDTYVQLDLIDQKTNGQQNIRLWFDENRNLQNCWYFPVDIGQPTTMMDRFYQSNTRRLINLREFRLQLTEELHEKCRDLMSAYVSRGARRRQKRSNPFIMPGTRWCGKGNAATREQMFGDEIEVDVCCFEHDHCAENIPSMVRKYGHFNTSPVTLSHCDCDDRFLECLENAGTYAANRVGNIYFNLFKIPCFRRVNRTVCTSRSERSGLCVRTVTFDGIELYHAQTYTSDYELR